MIQKIINKIRELLTKKVYSIDKSSKISKCDIIGSVTVGKRCLIHGAYLSGRININDNTSIWGPNIHIISGLHEISIGKFCSIAQSVTIQEYNHNMQRITSYFIHKNIFEQSMTLDIISKGPITIGNDVWIGTGVQIMSGVTVGDGAVIAANSTITHDVPPYAIVGGVPAKVLKYRFSDEIIAELLRIQWWNWDLEKIKQNKPLFSVNLTLEMLEKYN